MTTTTPETTARDVLRDSRHAVEPSMRAAVDRLDPATRALAAYHLGWTDADGRPSASSGGKAVRPALTLLAARAAGAPGEVGLPGAVAVELVHNFSLLHDDLMDGDVERRHRRTVWAQFGVAGAVLTGDAMLTLAQQVLLEAPSPAAAEAAGVLADATQELVRGQAEDLAFERRSDVSVGECLAMAGGKTGALLAASTAIGGLLAGAPAGTVTALTAYGRELGLAFQLVDDLLGIWGEPERTGKPVLSDLRSRKKTLPVTYATSQPGPAARELAAWLASPPSQAGDSEAALRHVADLVERTGGREWAESEARSRLAAGEQALDDVRLADGAREQLRALGRYLVERDC